MKKLLIIAALALLSGQLKAEVLDIGSGFNLESESKVTIDAGLSTGDIDLYGGRASFLLSDNFILFGNAGIADVGFDDEETAYGAGGLIKIDIDLPFMFGIKGSYHMFEQDVDLYLAEFTVELTEIAVRAVASGQFSDVDELLWFAEAGIHMLEAEASIEDALIDASNTYDDNEIGLEGGIIFNLSEAVSLTGSLEIVDDNWLNLGVKFAF